MQYKWTFFLATLFIAGFALETEYITHCPNYIETGSEIFTVFDAYNCVATAVSTDELFVSCGQVDTNDKGNYNLTQGDTVTFSATSDDPTGFDLTYESTWETLEIHEGENITVRCWNFTASAFNASPLEPIPDPEPEPDRYTGYDHICKEITLNEESQVTVHFKFEEYSDNYLRYFMYSYDCPGLQGERKYASSGCSVSMCNSSGEWCHMGTASGRFEQTITLTLGPGVHEICGWPSSIRNYLWDAEINYYIGAEQTNQTNSSDEKFELDKISITDVLNHFGVIDLIVWSGTMNPPPITNISFELPSGEIKECDSSITQDNPIMLQQEGSIGITCNNIEYASNTSVVVTFYTETDSKEFVIATRGAEPLEPVGTVSTEVCPQKGENDCMQNSGCYWTSDCGCLHETIGCATPLEQSEIIMNCPLGCVCYPDGAIHCATVETDPAMMAETMLCHNGCILNGRCVTQGTRANIENYSKYCGIYGEWEIQKPLNEFCQNNYECHTNTCASGQCYDVIEEVEKTRGLLQRILDFFVRIFGIDIRS